MMNGRQIMNWGIYDDYTIRTLKPLGAKTILIRVLEPSYKQMGVPYQIDYINEYMDVLELYFDDIDREFEGQYKDRFVLFDEVIAKKLNQFILKNEFNEVRVHCNAGIRRSSATMICISRILERPDIEEEIKNCNRYIPNELVLNRFNNCKVTPKPYKGEVINNNKDFCNKESKMNFTENDDGSISLIF